MARAAPAMARSLLARDRSNPLSAASRVASSRGSNPSRSRIQRAVRWPPHSPVRPQERGHPAHPNPSMNLAACPCDRRATAPLLHETAAGTPLHVRCPQPARRTYLDSWMDRFEYAPGYLGSLNANHAAILRQAAPTERSGAACACPRKRRHPKATTLPGRLPPISESWDRCVRLVGPPTGRQQGISDSRPPL